MKRKLQSLFLFVVAVPLVGLFVPIGVLSKIIFSICYRSFDWLWFERVALSLDQLAGVIGDDLFNWMLIKDDCIAPFGDEDETMSSVLGKNFLEKNLTIVGRLAKNFLNLLQKNHVVQAIED